jgi:tRNA modification GTPase
MFSAQETIAAIATPPGQGGVGIIRISGPDVKKIAKAVLGFIPQPRFAIYNSFYDEYEHILDSGIAIYFPNPHSFTGEDVLELQGHGGPVILDCLLRHLVKLGARLARPGEFSERAYLNNKIDLVQAEAIADLINAASEQAARAAMRSLQGEFSTRIQTIVETLVQLRIYVEAAIDFPEEEIDFLSDGKIADSVASLIKNIMDIQIVAQQGALLREGMNVVIAGAPNAGKSSLLNALSGRDIAIVTEIPGTTRDVLRDQIQIDGLPLHIIDTAGLRVSDDIVEQIGINRAKKEIEKADRILLVIDNEKFENSNLKEIINEYETIFPEKNLTIIRNKIDKFYKKPSIEYQGEITIISISAKLGYGIDLLREHLKTCIGFQSSIEGNFIARRRHLDAIERAKKALLNGQDQLLDYRAGELLAEELKTAQQALGEITGEFTSDDLLGRIFSSFCIGK